LQSTIASLVYLGGPCTKAGDSALQAPW